MSPPNGPSPFRLFLFCLATFLLLSPARADGAEPEGAIVDEVGALSDAERSEIRAAIDGLLLRCDLAVAIALAPSGEKSAAAARATALRREMRARGILPRASTVFVFAGEDLAAWDGSRSGRRVLPDETVQSAWQGTADVAPFPARLVRFIEALSGACSGRGTAAPPEGEDDEEESPDGVGSSPPQLAPPGPTGKFEVYLSAEWNLPGSPMGDFLSFATDSAEFPDHPLLAWSGCAFECAAFATEPAAEVWNDKEKRISMTRRERRCRLFGAVSADGKTLLRLTIAWRSLHLRDDDLVLEYQEWSAALTNVPASSGPPQGTNPLAGGPSQPGLSFEIAGQGRETLDHVLEFTRRRGYPAYPETEYAVSHALLTRVVFRFSGS